MTAESQPQSILWYRTPVDREILQAFHRRSDFKGLLQAGAHLALICLTGAVAWALQDRPLLLIDPKYQYVPQLPTPVEPSSMAAQSRTPANRRRES